MNKTTTTIDGYFATPRTQPRAENGQYKTTTNVTKPNKEKRVWFYQRWNWPFIFVSITLVATIAALGYIGYSHWVGTIKSEGFAQGRQAGIQEQIQKQEAYEKMRLEILAEHASEKK